jgi:hypothetical protein
MTDGAINDLLNTNINAAKYTVDSARRVRVYQNRGYDPTQFHVWNQQYWPQEDVVNQKQTSGPAARTATGPNGQKLYLRNGKWSA